MRKIFLCSLPTENATTAQIYWKLATQKRIALSKELASNSAGSISGCLFISIGEMYQSYGALIAIEMIWKMNWMKPIPTTEIIFG